MLDPFTLAGFAAAFYGVYRIFYKRDLGTAGSGVRNQEAGGSPDAEIGPFQAALEEEEPAPEAIEAEEIGSGPPDEEETAMAGKATARRCRAHLERVQNATRDCCRIGQAYAEYGRRPVPVRAQRSGETVWQKARSDLCQILEEGVRAASEAADEEHVPAYVELSLGLQSQLAVCGECEAWNQARLDAGEAFVCRTLGEAMHPDPIKAAALDFYLDDSGNIVASKE